MKAGMLEGVPGGHAVHRLAEAVAQTVVGVGIHAPARLG